MKIDRVSAAKVQVLLGADDMKTLNMSYPTISWENQRTKDMIQGILDIAGRETGFRRKGERLLIEVFEPKRGECGFIFTLLSGTSGTSGRRNFRVVRPSAPQLYWFATSEDLLAAVQAVARLGRRRGSRSKLFRTEEGYFLVLYPFQKLDPHVDSTFCEFGEKKRYSTYAVAALAERGTVIAEGDVLSRMIAPAAD